MKLKTKIEHSFDIDPDLMEDLDFIVDIPSKSIKMKTKIVQVKKRKIKIKTDASTRLF